MSSFGTMPAGRAEAATFDNQLRRILQPMNEYDRVRFLAGVRFAQGHAEYGDQVWTMPIADLRYEQDQEEADRLVYGWVLEARGGA